MGKNRASVVVWSVGNETPLGDPRLKFMTNLVKKARSLDDTRLVAAALELHRTPDNVVHVDDVAEGHALALERGRLGERYILGGEDLPMPALLALVDDAVGRTQRRVRLPHGALLPVALAAEGMARAFGIEPMVTREMLAMAKKRMFFRSAKARGELGYAPRPARQAVADAVAWFRANGVVRA